MDNIALHARTRAAISGALVGIGAVAVADGSLLQRLIEWCHAVPGEYRPTVGAVFAVDGVAMLAIGLTREGAARGRGTLVGEAAAD